MRCYKILSNQVFTKGEFSIVPIRSEDSIKIMNWRNEQIYHLRQDKPLTIADQEKYFASVVSKLFNEDQPDQLLFSFLENGECIGYGGLVHINRIDKNAEISFLMRTESEQDFFAKYWSNYLQLIEKVAFEELNLHKIFTYAFDLRPYLYSVLETCGFNEEARLKEHCYFDNQFWDVVYHCKINRRITFRRASRIDMMLYFNWANDTTVRQNSYQSEPISLEAHENWFYNKIENPNSFMVVFEDHLNHPIGQVRIEKQDEKTAVIGISNNSNQRGKGYATRMIQMATDEFLKENPNCCISAFIKSDNTASEKAFKKAGYQLDGFLEHNSHPSYHYIKKYENRGFPY